MSALRADALVGLVAKQHGDRTAFEGLTELLGSRLIRADALCQGDFERTRHAREARDLLALQSPFNDEHRETSVRWEALANYRAGDLLGVKELVQGTLEQLAQRGAAPVNPVLELALLGLLATMSSDALDASTLTQGAGTSLLLSAEGLTYFPIMLRDSDQPHVLLGVVVVGASEPFEIGRGLLVALGQTLKALLEVG